VVARATSGIEINQMPPEPATRNWMIIIRPMSSRIEAAAACSPKNGRSFSGPVIANPR
jgi:hypothetical protein